MHHVVRCLVVLSLVLPAVARGEEPAKACSKKHCTKKASTVAEFLTGESCPEACQKACAAKAGATTACDAKKCAGACATADAKTACAKGECSQGGCAAGGCEGCPAMANQRTKPCPSTAYLSEACPNADCQTKACCQTAATTKQCAQGCDTSACSTASACSACGCPEKKLKHLVAAAHHLRAAGLQDAANDVFEAAREVRRDLLRIKLDELARLRWEVERLQAGESLFEPAATAKVPSETPTK